MFIRKQQALHADPKAILHISFTGNLGQAGSTSMFFIIEEVKETCGFFARNRDSIVYSFWFII